MIFGKEIRENPRSLIQFAHGLTAQIDKELKGVDVKQPGGLEAAIAKLEKLRDAHKRDWEKALKQSQQPQERAR